ncbi:MAG: hypothetical protein OEV49_07555 [candidate division Zixibacteria bacterium]|nr:hypothetical protein [candidate division Zixibacteria bacterium]MDH3936077.1 hypothetical protein [candidate division Zixibacteria bacterium]MDH4032223.1 hypothetical protein [candidate division Zixibacteria bacterium]
MTVYKNKKSHSMKWLIALVIFVLGMTITWSSVEGAEVSSTMSIHKAHTAHASFGRSRFHPNWFPGFLKPPRTILASATLRLDVSDNRVLDVKKAKLDQLDTSPTLRTGYISQS